MPVLEEAHGVVEVFAIRCPLHGDVTLELAPPGWDGTATVVLTRSGAVHDQTRCSERLVWNIGPVRRPTHA